MNTFIILLRGIMPTGKNKVPMALLREVLTKTGFKNVRTYIASGNALVESEFSQREIENRVHELIQKTLDLSLIKI